MKILIWPNPILKRPSQRVVSPLDPALLQEMLRTMYAAGGVGLAAIQVGIAESFFIGQVNGKVEVFVNPIWKPTKRAVKSRVSEGCLSFPGIREWVQRWDEVLVSYLDPELKSLRAITLDGLEAQIVQHETEHLNGMVFLDQLDSGAKDRARKLLRGRNFWDPGGDPGPVAGEDSVG